MGDVKITKAALIRQLLALKWRSEDIAKHVDTTVNRVCVIRWSLRHPTYCADWMARKRSSDSAYYARELRQQKRYNRAKRAETLSNG